MSRRFLMPGVLLLAYLFLFAPILAVAAASISGQAVLSFPPRAFTTHWYWAIQPAFWQAVRVSLMVASITTLIAVLLGLPAALALARGRFPGRDMLNALCLSPLMVPTLVIGIACYQFAGLVWDITGVSLTRTLPGLVLGHLTFAIPFVIRGILAGQANHDLSLEDAAQNLGATPLQTFRLVTLPLIRPGIVSGAIFAFMMSLDDVPIALFLGGTPDSTTLPVKILAAVEFDFRGDIMALSTVIVGATLLASLLLDRLVGLDRLFGAHR